MRTLFLALFILIATPGRPQGPSLISEGMIRFERRERLPQPDPQKNPEFRTLRFVLRFNNHKAVYEQDNTATATTTTGLPGEGNIVFHDLGQHSCIRQRNVIGQLFLLERPSPEIVWKITNETRSILGFECRRANAMILDSIYAVAFYTEDIIPPLGPDSFAGLPGMILGVVLPHKHMTWFATSIEPVEIKDKDITAPEKGTRKTTPQLMEIIRSGIGAADPHLEDYLYLYLM